MKRIKLLEEYNKIVDDLLVDIIKDVACSTIDAHLKKVCNGSVNYKEWYCGITNDFYERLEQHRNDKYPNLSNEMYYYVEKEEIAREVEKYYLKSKGGLGMEGNTGGGDPEKPPVYVYVFKMNSP